MADEYAALGPDDYKERLDSPMSPFFTAWGHDLGESHTSKLLAAKDLVKARYGRSKIRQMLGLTEGQFEGILSEVGADPYWRLVCEEYLGAKFAKPQVPASAEAISRPIYQTPNDSLRQEDKPSGKASTIAAMLGVKVMESTLPLAALTCMLTACPKLNPITPPDHYHATTEICAAFFCEHGTLSAGATMIRHMAGQFRAVAKAPLVAKGNARFKDPTAKAIAIKLGNWDRKDARVCSRARLMRLARTHAMLIRLPESLTACACLGITDIMRCWHHPCGSRPVRCGPNRHRLRQVPHLQHRRFNAS
jgi:hypothetical protein